MNLKPDELGKLTLTEFIKLVNGYNLRYERAMTDIRWVIWHLGALIRSDKYPKFNDFVQPKEKATSRPTRKRTMTSQEMYNQVENLNKLFGGVVVHNGGEN